MNVFTYDPETHVGKLDGIVIPSVTQILKVNGLIPDFGSEEAMWRGTCVDQACQLLAKNDLDWDSVDPRIEGYVRAFERFLADAKPEIIQCHTQLYHPTLRYFGEFDFLLNDALIDIKTGSRAAWHSLQLSAYDELCEANGSIDKRRRLSVYLRSFGKYQLNAHDNNRADFKKFLTLLSAYWIRREYA